MRKSSGRGSRANVEQKAITGEFESVADEAKQDPQLTNPQSAVPMTITRAQREMYDRDHKKALRALDRANMEPGLIRAGEEGLKEVIGRKANGRKPNPKGTEDPERYHDPVNPRAGHLARKVEQSSAAIGELIEAGISPGTAITKIDSKRGRVPKAFE